eukprot:symbB.v1.2.035965.t1/scaffold4768.1/size35182/4
MAPGQEQKPLRGGKSKSKNKASRDEENGGATAAGEKQNLYGSVSEDPAAWLKGVSRHLCQPPRHAK